MALEERLAQRRPLGFRGAEPNMTVQELGEYWMRRRREEARDSSTDSGRVKEIGAVSPQTLAGYQSALSHIINPHLGGLRLTEARTGVVDEALTRVDLSGRTTRVARSVLAQMFAMAVRHDALVSNPMREVRRAPRRRRAVQALTVEQARDLLELTRVPPETVLLATSAACCWVAPGERPTCTTWCFCCWARGCASARPWPCGGPTSTCTPTSRAYAWPRPWSSRAVTPPAGRYSSLGCTVNR